MATDAEERAVADLRFGSGTPATLYWALSTTVPNEDGSNFTEPVGNAYARVAVTNNTTNFPAATTSSGLTVKTNGTAITFPNPTGAWGLLVYYGIYAVSSGGTPNYVNPLDTQISPQSGNTPVQFAANDWQIAIE
jgi:hypothetical protein